MPQAALQEKPEAQTSDDELCVLVDDLLAHGPSRYVEDGCFRERVIERTALDGNPSRFSQTGEEYVEISERGSTEHEGLARFLFALGCYAAAKKGVIYWRIRPECDVFPETTDIVTREKSINPEPFVFYARLLISAKPVLERIA